MNNLARFRARPTHVSSVAKRHLQFIRSFLPHGYALPEIVWQRRHRAIVGVLWFHAPVIVLFALGMGHTWTASIVQSLPVVISGIVAMIPQLSRRLRSGVTSLGLISSSALLVHLANGAIEMHFHFFVAIGIITLYQDWTPYILATAFVILHHGVIGVLSPTSVYNNAAAWERPWQWAIIHAGFVCIAGLVGLVNWRFIESERERAETALRERVAAEEALHLRDQFVSLAAHELKTPLTALLGYLDVVQRRTARSGMLSERDAHALQVAADQANRLNTMVHTLLDVTRLETGQLQITCATVDVAALVRRIAAEAGAGLEQHTLQIVGCDTPLPIEGDALRLEQVVQNLVQNAIKYSPEGGTISICLSHDDRYAFFSVRDQGIGIPPAALPHIFSRFFRANNADAQHIGGLGIGLYVVHEIVARHGGAIEVHSQEGHGTTFRVSLPLGAATPVIDMQSAMPAG